MRNMASAYDETFGGYVNRPQMFDREKFGFWKINCRAFFISHDP